LVGGAFDTDFERARAFAAELELDPNRVYPNIDDFVKGELALPESERIEAVTVVTPNFLHYPMAKQLIEAGFNVICEKPCHQHCSGSCRT
jgi:predicted dehydrogenase